MKTKFSQKLKYDVRMKDLYIQEGRASESELSEYKQKLPDLSAQTEKIKLEGERRNSSSSENS